MAKNDKAIGALKECIDRGKIRVVQNEHGSPTYFTTAKGKAALASVGIGTLAARSARDAEGNDFGEYVHRIKMDGRDGLLKRVGNIDEITKVMSGVQVVPQMSVDVASPQAHVDRLHAHGQAGEYIGVRY